MKSYMKSMRHTLENKNVALPFYALLGTSAVFLIRHLLFNKSRPDNFRAGATQFDHEQLGTLEPHSSNLDKDNSSKTDYSAESIISQTNLSTEETKSILEETLTPENHSLATSEWESSVEQNELTAGDIDIPESSLIESIDEVTVQSPQNKEQCRAITKKGTRCRNKADSSGYCFQHRTFQ